MNEIIELLDKNLEYVKYVVDKEYIKIWVEPSNTEAECPYCKTKSSKVHSRYERSFEYLPIKTKK